MMELKEFAAVLERSIATITPQLEVGVDRVGALAQTLAAEYPGYYQRGWKELAESTIEDKMEKGFPVPYPLLRTGEMRDSVQREMDLSELAVAVGSRSKIALYQEMGTSRGIPPRPFLALGIQNALPFAREVFGRIATSLLTGRLLR